jgi:hypothetical protein
MCVANTQFGAHNAKTPAALTAGVLMVPNVQHEDAVCITGPDTPVIQHLGPASKRAVKMVQSVHKPVQHPLIGVGVHFKDEHGRVEHQAMVIDIIPTHSDVGDLVRLQYYEWLGGSPSTQALVPLREMIAPRWVLYSTPEAMNEHYERVDASRNRKITERLERTKGPRS